MGTKTGRRPNIKGHRLARRHVARVRVKVPRIELIDLSKRLEAITSYCTCALLALHFKATLEAVPGSIGLFSESDTLIMEPFTALTLPTTMLGVGIWHSTSE